MTNFRKPSGVGFGCVAGNVFDVFLVLYMSDTNNEVNPELEKSRTFSVHDICRAHQIWKMLATVCCRLKCKCTMNVLMSVCTAVYILVEQPFCPSIMHLKNVAFACCLKISTSALLRAVRMAIRVLYFAFRSVSQTISLSKCWKAKNSLYTYHFSFKFRVSLMPGKDRLWNSLTFCENANPGAKCCKMQRKKRRETQKKLCKIPLYTLFIFRILWEFHVISR